MKTIKCNSCASNFIQLLVASNCFAFPPIYTLCSLSPSAHPSLRRPTNTNNPRLEADASLTASNAADPMLFSRIIPRTNERVTHTR